MQPYFPDLEFTTIPNGIDTSFFSPDAEPLEALRGKRTIVFVGRFDPRNGVKHMIGAFTALRRTRDDVRLVIVGDGPLRVLVERMVPSELREDVVFAGRVNRLRPRYLASAEILCTPCSLASFGMVLLEGMSAGLPVVASRLPGFELVMRDGVDGLMVDRADDEVGFAAALDQLLDDPRSGDRWAQQDDNARSPRSPGPSWPPGWKRCTRASSTAPASWLPVWRLPDGQEGNMGRRGTVAVGVASIGIAVDRRLGTGPFATTAGAAAAGLYLAGTFFPKARIFGSPTDAVTSENLLALTFDDGPDPRYTLEISRALAERGHQATFFVLARAIRAHHHRSRSGERRPRSRLPRRRARAARIRYASRGSSPDRRDGERRARGDGRPAHSTVSRPTRRSKPMAEPRRQELWLPHVRVGRSSVRHCRSRVTSDR